MKERPTRPVVAVGVLIVDADRVLLVQRARAPQIGRWTVPGGKVELGESLEDAALRELREETGLSATLGPIVEILDRVVRDDRGEIAFHYVILDFIGSEPRGEIQGNDESLDVRFVPLAELSSYPLTDGLSEVIARALAMRSEGAPGPVRATERLKA